MRPAKARRPAEKQRPRRKRKPRDRAASIAASPPRWKPATLKADPAKAKPASPQRWKPRRREASQPPPALNGWKRPPARRDTGSRPAATPPPAFPLLAFSNVFSRCWKPSKRDENGDRNPPRSVARFRLKIAIWSVSIIPLESVRNSYRNPPDPIRWAAHTMPAWNRQNCGKILRRRQ